MDLWKVQADDYDIESVIFLLKLYCNVVEELACFKRFPASEYGFAILIEYCFLGFIFVYS